MLLVNVKRGCGVAPDYVPRMVRVGLDDVLRPRLPFSDFTRKTPRCLAT
jgi:hypothetical protein